jgi:hypothetical protein
MKHAKDDFKSKYKLWLDNPPVFTPPTSCNLPYFGHRRFNNYNEMNVWKREYLAEIARCGGVQWKN